jgi:hypothetical protein
MPYPIRHFRASTLRGRCSGEALGGPNAGLAFAREAYRRRDIRPLQLIETLTYPGLISLRLVTGVAASEPKRSPKAAGSDDFWIDEPPRGCAS